MRWTGQVYGVSKQSETKTTEYITWLIRVNDAREFIVVVVALWFLGL